MGKYISITALENSSGLTRVECMQALWYSSATLWSIVTKAYTSKPGGVANKFPEALFIPEKITYNSNIHHLEK